MLKFFFILSLSCVSIKESIELLQEREREAWKKVYVLSRRKGETGAKNFYLQFFFSLSFLCRNLHIFMLFMKFKGWKKHLVHCNLCTFKVIFFVFMSHFCCFEDFILNIFILNCLVKLLSSLKDCLNWKEAFKRQNKSF